MRYLFLIAFIVIAFVFACPGMIGAQEKMGAGELDRTSNWRFTKQGWIDSSDWKPPVSEERPIERVSPVLFAANILLATLFALIWASNECEVGKLLGDEHCQTGTRENVEAPEE